MGFSYENQGSNAFLVYTLAPDEEIDSMSLGMLTNNKLNGLVPTLFTQMDDERYIKYITTGRITAKDCFNGVVSKRRLIGLFRGVIEAMRTAEDYMIDSASILLDLQYIFMNVTTCDTQLICLPIMGSPGSGETVKEFFKGVLFRTQYDQTENCDYVAKLMNYLNSSPQFNLDGFESLLATLDENTVAPAPAQKTTVAVHRTQMTQPSVPHTGESVATTVVVKPAPQPAVPHAAPQQQQQKPAWTPPTPPTPQPAAKQAPAQNTKSGEKMSMWYLLNHYSKENVELYRAQKNTKDAEETSKTAKKPDKKKSGKTSAAPAFAIPGQTIPIQTPPQPVAAAAASSPAPRVMPQATQSAPAASSVPRPPMPPMGERLDFGETTILVANNNIGETTLLVAQTTEQRANPHLVRMRTHENIPVNKEVFRVGKERSYVDYFIGDNTAVSRSHANIVCHDGNYFIVDTNSKNHTFVNEAMIPSNTEVALNDGDRVRLANEEFEFYLK